jgi:hypothetical protein
MGCFITLIRLTKHLPSSAQRGGALCGAPHGGGETDVAEEEGLDLKQSTRQGDPRGWRQRGEEQREEAIFYFSHLLLTKSEFLGKASNTRTTRAGAAGRKRHPQDNQKGVPKDEARRANTGCDCVFSQSSEAHRRRQKMTVGKRWGRAQIFFYSK